MSISVHVVCGPAVTRAAFVALLEGQEVHVSGASDTGLVREAIDFINAQVLLLYTDAGAIDLSTIQMIRQRRPDIGIVMLTDTSDTAYLRVMLAAGAHAYVHLCSDPENLSAAVRAAVGGGRYLDPVLSETFSDLVLGIDSDPRATVLDQLLSAREQQVLQLLALGHTSREMAEKLGIRVKTIETYRSRLSEKLNLQSRAEVVRFALHLGILTPGVSGQAV